MAIAPIFSLLPHLHTSTYKEEENKTESDDESDDAEEESEYAIQSALASAASILRHLCERRKLGEEVHVPDPSIFDMNFLVRVLEGSLSLLLYVLIRSLY